jgi:hypothetical protein
MTNNLHAGYRPEPPLSRLPPKAAKRAAIIIGTIAALSIWGSFLPKSPPNPDIHVLWTVAESAKSLSFVVDSSLSGWNSAIDVTIGSRDQLLADEFAFGLCRNVNLGLKDRDWKVQVYFPDKTLAATCRLH